MKAREIIEELDDDRLDAALSELGDPELVNAQAREIIASFLLAHKGVDERVLAYMRDMVDDFKSNDDDFNLDYTLEGAAEMATETVIIDELGDIQEPFLTAVWELLKERYVELAQQAGIGQT
jgi:hypothetical protein